MEKGAYNHQYRKVGGWLFPFCLSVVLLFSSCARMGQPDGGWYDETPPRVVGASPADGGVNVKSKKISIYFNEFIKLDNPTEKVVVSPPQLEMPEIKAGGKHIQVELLDSLKPNTTYTIDFSDAISDNNENNPMGNYTYSFSTGEAIDTMEVSGYVLEAQNLEPIKGILVGLYPAIPESEIGTKSDTLFTTKPMIRVSRTDSRGRFVIKGIATGSYRVFALQDADGNYFFNHKSEKIAFNHDIITPSSYPDTRQDTLWTDSLHIKIITPTAYTHFVPDNIVLTAFTQTNTDRVYIKNERKEPDHFTLFFSYGSDSLPVVRGLNFDDRNAFVVEAGEKRDTVTYWLRDTALVNQDTLNVAMNYLMTDSLGKLVTHTDTLEILSKQPYAKRLKQREKEYEKWEKQQEKRRKRGEPFDSVMPVRPLEVDIKLQSELDPDKNIRFSFPTPLARIDTSAIHLYAKHDTLWYRAPMEFDRLQSREYELKGEWRPDIEYSLEIDSAAFQDIYGKASVAVKKGFKVRSLDAYSSLLVTLQGLNGEQAVVQLLDNSEKVVKEVTTGNGVAEFFYVAPGGYYMRMYVDINRNGRWDTGSYADDRQPEPVYYYPEKIECRAKWDVTESWNPTARTLNLQKPGAITKQKPDKEKKIKSQNAKRAKELGIKYLPDELKL